MPWPVRPVSVSISVRHTDNVVCLFSPRTLMVTGTLSGVADTRTIFMRSGRRGDDFDLDQHIGIDQ